MAAARAAVMVATRMVAARAAARLHAELHTLIAAALHTRELRLAEAPAEAPS